MEKQGGGEKGEDKKRRLNVVSVVLCMCVCVCIQVRLPVSSHKIEEVMHDDILGRQLMDSLESQQQQPKGVFCVRQT